MTIPAPARVMQPPWRRVPEPVGFALGALALRVAWVALVPSKPVGDFAMYWESAAHLLAHGALDDEFVYMPGYVLLLAGVQALGGGWLAAKLVGALLGAAAAGAVHVIARVLWDRAAARVAAVLAMVWPAGIAVASVLGTDMPAAALLTIAVACLLHDAPARPLRAAALFGVGMGLVATIRAVALPLAALGGLHLLLVRAGWRRALAGGTLAVGVALLVLAPWAWRNHRRYGEWILTDSHGGLTALVGANPNTDGRYSRSLNRMFTEVTGFRFLAEPHRAADRAAYAIAKDWARFEPAYALALLGTKADRLLGRERSLLYWPLYRAGVLRDPQRAFVERWRSPTERVTDAFWFAIVAAALAGVAVGLKDRRWGVATPLAMQAALVAIYTVFFAEPRYHMPIALLAFPPAGAALVAARRGFFASERRSWGRVIVAVGTPVVLLVSWFFAKGVAETRRDAHRWGVSVCDLGDKRIFCKWRRDDGGVGPSPVIGVHDGVGLAGLPGPERAATTTIDVPGGGARITGRLEASGPALEAGLVTLTAGGNDLAVVPVSALLAPQASAFAIDATIAHGGGALPVKLRWRTSAPPTAPGTSVWLLGLKVQAGQP